MDFNPYIHTDQIQEALFDLLHDSCGSEHDNEDRSLDDYLADEKRAAKKLKEVLYQARELNKEYIETEFKRIRQGIDSMVDAIELDENGALVADGKWFPWDRMPTYRQLVHDVIRDGLIRYIFFNLDTQIFFLERHQDKILECLEGTVTDTGLLPYGNFSESCEFDGAYEFRKNDEDIYTVFLPSEKMVQLKKNTATVNIVLVNDDWKSPIGMVESAYLEKPLLIGDWKSRPDLHGTNLNIKNAIKIQTEDRDEEPNLLVRIFDAYLSKGQKYQPWDLPVAVVYQRRDRCEASEVR